MLKEVLEKVPVLAESLLGQFRDPRVSTAFSQVLAYRQGV